jgi:hypothetical protein
MQILLYSKAFLKPTVTHQVLSRVIREMKRPLEPAFADTTPVYSTQVAIFSAVAPCVTHRASTVQRRSLLQGVMSRTHKAYIIIVKVNVPLTDTKAQMGVEVQLYSFLTSAVEGSGWSAPRPGRFTPWKDPVPTVQEAGPQGRCGRVRKISPQPEFDPWTVQSDWAFPVPNYYCG